MADDDPYRTAGADRLGALERTFATPRRNRYAGSARVATRVGMLTLGSMAVPTARTTSLPWTRSIPGEVVEVCARGLRVRGRTGVLELLWDQIVRWDPVRHGDVVVAIELGGRHGEALTFDRTLRGLAELYALVAARRGP